MTGTTWIPTEGDAAVQVTGLSKSYGAVPAVDQLTFTVRAGEVFGFLGPNGAGKTTTVRMLTGVTLADAGQAMVLGHPAGSIAAKQLSGVVPELSNAYLDLSGWGNLMLMAELYRLPRARAREQAERLLRVFELYERKDAPAKAYSMGMRRRLIVAAALISDPRIVFLDEPTSGLDVQSARAVRRVLRQLRHEGRTIFLTTHNMEEAAELCDRVGIIHRGRLVALDSPEKLRLGVGGVSLLDVAFDRAVVDEELLALPGVDRLEGVRAMEEAERMRRQAAMAGKRPGRGAGAPAATEGGGGVEGNPPRPPAGTKGGVPDASARAALSADDTGHRVRLYSGDTTLLLTSLVDFSRARSLRMRILELRSPSLEDAFIRLTEEQGHER